MRAAWAQRPTSTDAPIRSGTGLLADFEVALSGGDVVLAQECLAELRTRGLISAENGRFLELRQLAAMGRWGTMAGAVDLDDLARVRRPWLVTESLLTALYRVELAPYESTLDVTGAIQQARHLADSYTGLFATIGPLRDPSAVAAVALVRASRSGTARDDIADLAALPGLPRTTAAWLQAVAETVAPRTFEESESARGALQRGDLDRAYRLACAEPPSRTVTELLLHCAYELETLEAAVRAVSAMSALSADERAAVYREAIES